MGGVVFVNEVVSWKAGGLAYSGIIAATRERILTLKSDFPDQVFDTEDQGLKFIALDELSSFDFKVFATDCCHAFELFRDSPSDWQRQSALYDGYLVIWSELLELLEGDPRFSRDGGGP